MTRTETDGVAALSYRDRIATSFSGVRSRMHEPVDPASLVAFRFVLGGLLFAATVRFWANGWIDAHYNNPQFFFKYYGFSWVSPLPESAMTGLFALMALSAAFIALGLFYRISAAAFCALFTYAHFIDKTHYLNHYYFVSVITALLVLTPLHRAASLDRRFGLVPKESSIPRWALWLLRFQVGVVYFFAGLAKLTPDWLFHAQPLTIWLGANTDFPLIGPLFRYKATAYAMSWVGAGFDLSVPFLLSFRRTRPFAYAAVVVFHGLTGMLFPIGMFPWMMTASALIFFPEDWPRRVLPARIALRLWPARSEPSEPSKGGAFGGDKGRLLATVLALHVAIQVLFPLRNLLYPGQVCWTEQGFRFSWKVMLVEKNGDVEITAIDPASGKRWVIDPREHLYAYQIKQMSTQPDMIAEYCRFIAAELRARGYKDIEVHANVLVAWNGRPPAPLIDPTVDLGREPDGLSPYSFVLPAPSMPPSM